MTLRHPRWPGAWRRLLHTPKIMDIEENCENLRNPREAPRRKNPRRKPLKKRTGTGQPTVPAGVPPSTPIPLRSAVLPNTTTCRSYVVRLRGPSVVPLRTHCIRGDTCTTGISKNRPLKLHTHSRSEPLSGPVALDLRSTLGSPDGDN